jgi:hypothetical protein
VTVSDLFRSLGNETDNEEVLMLAHIYGGCLSAISVGKQFFYVSDGHIKQVISDLMDEGFTVEEQKKSPGLYKVSW